MKAVFEKKSVSVLRMSAGMCMCNCAHFPEFTLSCVDV